MLSTSVCYQFFEVFTSKLCNKFSKLIKIFTARFQLRGLSSSCFFFLDFIIVDCNKVHSKYSDNEWNRNATDNNMKTQNVWILFFFFENSCMSIETWLNQSIFFLFFKRMRCKQHLNLKRANESVMNMIHILLFVCFFCVLCLLLLFLSLSIFFSLFWSRFENLHESV